MKALQFSVLLPALMLTLLTSCAQLHPPVMSEAGIAHHDHDALVRYYGDLAGEAKVKLQENKKLLEECEVHPYYFGWQGQDLRSHSSANIRRYEKILEESLRHVDLHRRMANEQKNRINQTDIDLERDFTAADPEYPGAEL
ncbi:MAG: hypothetical protein KF908_01980 [Nitrosomonas sp.]|nr:hypothetical protein [Nitrosomonas sp.]MCW5606868.1 hypothetical protein [Nitrosomonas sp.]